MDKLILGLIIYSFISSYNVNNYFITNKLIKREIIFKAYLFFQNRINGEKWNYHEDNIWSILINKYAQSMRCVNKIINPLPQY